MEVCQLHTHTQSARTYAFLAYGFLLWFDAFNQIAVAHLYPVIMCRIRVFETTFHIDLTSTASSHSRHVIVDVFYFSQIQTIVSAVYKTSGSQQQSDFNLSFSTRHMVVKHAIMVRQWDDFTRCLSVLKSHFPTKMYEHKWASYVYVSNSEK